VYDRQGDVRERWEEWGCLGQMGGRIFETGEEEEVVWGEARLKERERGRDT